MADKDPNVKVPKRKRLDPQRWMHDVLAFIDCHPRTGWMWFGLMILNTLLNLLDLFH